MIKFHTNFLLRLRRQAFAFRFAWRYLFSKKSHNAINIISGISATGVAIGTMALVVVLSVFNGFESLIEGMFSNFDPDLKITLQEGKAFDVDTKSFEQIKRHRNVAVFSEVIEENALLKYGSKQMPAIVKGVEPGFRKLSSIDSIMFDGQFQLYDGAFERSVVGLGVAGTLNLGVNFIDPLYIYAPKRGGRLNVLRPETSFNQVSTFPSGIFEVKQTDYDNQYVFISIGLARELFELDSTVVSAVELKLRSDADVKETKEELQKILGNSFAVKDRYEQQESFFKIMKIEKWITFLILSFILLIASFNIIGSLSMLIIDKKADIQTLRSLGASNRLIKNLFLYEGWLISAFGAFIGILLGSSICLIQEYFQIIRLGEGYVVEYYPIVTQFLDILLVFFTVIIMGFLAAWYPVRYINIDSE